MHIKYMHFQIFNTFVHIQVAYITSRVKVFVRITGYFLEKNVMDKEILWRKKTTDIREHYYSYFYYYYWILEETKAKEINPICKSRCSQGNEVQVKATSPWGGGNFSDSADSINVTSFDANKHVR